MRRPLLANARLVTDIAAVVFVTVVTERDVWLPGGVLGTHVAGPRWLTASLPLLIALPLPWRRRYPLGVWLLFLVGSLAQALASGDAAEGLELVVPYVLGGYAVAAYSPRRRAAAGLGLFAAAYTVVALNDRTIAQGGQQIWAGAFWGLLVLVFWFAGVVVRSRREAASLAAEAARLEREAEVALGEERTRIARELHDLISHTVSVIGLQAGAAERVLARDPERAREQLESIQDRARESVLELRRLLGVLREGDDEAELSPQPRLAELGRLLEQVRAAGLDVALRVEGDASPLPSSLELSAYRIVQEALTNVLKHAQATRADVLLRYGTHSLGIEIVDDGRGGSPHGLGHGLIGMRERAALYGGTLRTGGSARGGFVVAAELPLEGTAS